jgi:hypothetical protein
MFVFRHDEAIGKKNRGIPANKLFSDVIVGPMKRGGVDGEFYRTALESITEQGDYNDSIKGRVALNLSEASSYSTELSSFSLNSDDSGSLESEEEPALSNVLYKPTFDSPVHRLVRATNPATPRQEAMDLFDKLHEWAIEATDEEIDRYAWEIRNQAIPELLEYIRVNVDDKQCVSEALALVKRLSCQQEFEALVLIESHAINVLVLALLSHNNNNNNSPIAFAPLAEYEHTCLFRRLWNFLMDIVLSPSVIEYFQRCDQEQRLYDQKQKHHQRMRLVTAVDLCLDRARYSISILWMEQIFEVLAMLLRTNDRNGDPQPNDDVRLQVWEKQIARKCQQIIATMLTTADSLKRESLCRDSDPSNEHLLMQAMSVFWMCLCDRDDDLSESLDGEALHRFVFQILSEFPLSGPIQGRGHQFLKELASKKSINLSVVDSASDKAQDNTLLTSDSNSTSSNNLNNEEETGIKAETENNEENEINAKDRSGPKAKISLIDLITTLLQKPCLCDDEKNLDDQTL